VEQTILELKNIHKRFGGIKALRDVDLSLKKGEIHALIGENGAGKSTLIKILTGVTQMDEGEIFLCGKKVRIEDPVAARFKGIAAIYQELSLVENLSVAQNIFLGNEPTRKVIGWIDNEALNNNASDYLKEFKIEIDPNCKISELGLGQKRIIEILKAISINAQILLLDEAATGMSEAEVGMLFKIMDNIKKQKVSMIYISHHLEEIFRICDIVTILRDGRSVGTFKINDVDKQTLIKTMIGREVDDEYPRRKLKPSSDILLQVEKFFAEGMLKPISLKLYKGEILGITGIIGAGKSELGEALFGSAKRIFGKLKIKGREVALRAPKDACMYGMAYIPEDRKNQGLFLAHSVEDNLLIANINKIIIGKLFLSLSKKRISAMNIAKKLRVIPLDMLTKVQNLSGGNQQKIVIGKWMIGNPDIIIMDEPTRGIDVGVKTEVYNLINDLADSGVGIIFLSSEFIEVKNICDRIIVLRKGVIVNEVKSDDTSSEEILAIALGEKNGR